MFLGRHHHSPGKPCGSPASDEDDQPVLYNPLSESRNGEELKSEHDCSVFDRRDVRAGAISRVVSRLKEHFARWSERDLSEERFAIVYLDGFHMKVRLARRVVSAPVLAVLGAAENGSKVLVSLRLAVSEAGVHWRAAIADLKARGLAPPRVIVSDGHKGLAKACEAWPEARVQRCTQHKWANLKMHCPVHAQAELKRDWDTIVRADDGLSARAAYRAFLEKWTKLVPAVGRLPSHATDRDHPTRAVVFGDHQARDVTVEVVQLDDVGSLEVGSRDDRHRHRRLLEIDLPLARRDCDLVQDLLGYFFVRRSPGRHGGTRRQPARQEDHDSGLVGGATHCFR